MKKLDASILNFIPKGSFYNTEDEQNKKMTETWNELFDYDRTVFTLLTILPGTAYSKGRMSHKLLDNPINYRKALIDMNKFNLPIDFEERIVLWNLKNETVPRTLKNLLMLTNKKLGRVNNAKTRRIILQYIFDRPNESLENMCIKYKQKLAKLVRHALGSQITHNILYEVNDKLFDKYIGKYNKDAIVPLHFLFNHLKTKDKVQVFEKEEVEKWNKLIIYSLLRELAEDNNIKAFIEIIKKYKNVIPFEVLLGFRNTYKLDIDKADLMESGKMSEKQKLMSQEDAKRSNAKVDVNYEKQDIYDLWKLYYFKIMNGDFTDIEKIKKAIDKQSEKKLDIDFGKTVVIFDTSKSMEGSKKRPMHPFLTGITLVSKLSNIEKVITTNNKMINDDPNYKSGAIIPCDSSKIHDKFLKAVEMKPETILIISDGYENEIKGMTNFVYEKIKDKIKDIKIVHINPVYAKEVGAARKLINDVTPLMVESYKTLKTSVIFNMIDSNVDMIKNILVKEYKKQIEKKD